MIWLQHLKKFEKSKIVTRGISSNNLGRLILLNLIENKFYFSQEKLYHKDDWD